MSYSSRLAPPLRQSTTSQEVGLPVFVDATDGDSIETGLTIANTDIKLWKTGATSWVSKNSGGATHQESGLYSMTLDDTDTNTAGPLIIDVHPTGALPVRMEFLVLKAATFDADVSWTTLFNRRRRFLVSLG